MQITPWDIYWITRADAIREASTAALGACGIAAFILVIMGPMLFDDMSGFDIRQFVGRKTAAAFVLLFVFAAIVRTATPTTRELCAILVIPAVANNEDVQALGEDVVTLAREWMQELRPEKEQ